MEIWDICDAQGHPTGRTTERGRPMQPGEFHRVVHVFIMNARGEFLLQKRSSEKTLWPGKWDFTGGAVLAGEDSLSGAQREVREELGIHLEPWQLFHAGRLIKKDHLVDVWFALTDIPLDKLVLQPGEVEDARFVSRGDMLRIVFHEEFNDPEYLDLMQQFLQDMTCVWMVRHAKPDTTVRDDMARPLTPEGMADTPGITDALKGIPLTAVYASPSRRTMDTVRHLADSRGLEVAADEDLRERMAGSWVEDFRDYAEHQWQDFNYSLPGGESLNLVLLRYQRVMNALLRRHRGECICVGTHGTALSVWLDSLMPAYGIGGFWRMIDKMPWIVCVAFYKDAFAGMAELEMRPQSLQKYLPGR